jgi:hypothetical protein
MRPLTPATIATWKKAKAAPSPEQDIIDRIGYIIRTIYKEIGEELSTWYFDGADEGEVGIIDIDDYGTGLFGTSIVYEPGLYDTMVKLKKEGVIDLGGDGLPTRWLYEDFEDELRAGIVAYEKHQVAEKEARAKKKIATTKSKNEKLAAIKAKLTPEEIKFLKL